MNNQRTADELFGDVGEYYTLCSGFVRFLIHSLDIKSRKKNLSFNRFTYDYLHFHANKVILCLIFRDLLIRNKTLSLGIRKKRYMKI